MATIDIGAPGAAAGSSVLARPLAAGEAVRYWRLSATHEARYDVPDAPMDGRMDPFFFLSTLKNFIPHEYPCRTAFRAERRGLRPVPAMPCATGRLWAPSGSDRVDLNAFWFRPTVIAVWAETVIEAETAGAATFRLTTSGGAVLWVEDSEAGFIADYTRNLDVSADFTVPLKAGPNRLRLYLDDLAERDTRFGFQLDYVSGPAARTALPVSSGAAVAAGLEALLETMAFDRPAYHDAPVRLVWTQPAPCAVTLDIRSASGAVWSAGALEAGLQVPADATEAALGPSASLPVGFHLLRIGVSAGGERLARTLAVEIGHDAGDGRSSFHLSERVAEALDHTATGQRDAVAVLARLATGRAGPETDAMITAALPAIEDCYDCADFALVPLLWSLASYGDAMAPEARNRLRAAILGYRYWMDEPGNDVQWYFSENHALLFHTCALLAGTLMPDATFVRSRRTGREQAAVGAERVRAWLDHFERWEMAEWNSAAYFPIDLKGLAALAALAPQADIRERAAAGVVRLFEIVARSAHHGLLTASQGRSYETTLCAARTLEVSALSRLAWGRGWPAGHVHALPLVALAMRDHGLTLPSSLQDVAIHTGDDAVEWCFVQGENRFVSLYHYKTRAYAMGSVAAYRSGAWGYQETVLHLRLGEAPEAQVWINHPGEMIQAGSGRPSFWGGCGTLPRVHQYRGLAVLAFDAAPEQPDFTHAWFPRTAFETWAVEGRTALARSGEGMVLLRGSADFVFPDSGPSRGTELRLPGRQGLWLVRLGAADQNTDFDRFMHRLETLRATTGEDGRIVVADPFYGEVVFHPDGVVEAEGRRLDPSDWTLSGQSRRMPA